MRQRDLSALIDGRRIRRAYCASCGGEAIILAVAAILNSCGFRSPSNSQQLKRCELCGSAANPSPLKIGISNQGDLAQHEQ